MENNFPNVYRSWPRFLPFPRQNAIGRLTIQQGSVPHGKLSAVAQLERPPLGAEAAEGLISRLEATGDYNVLRRLVPRKLTAPAAAADRIGVIVDYETTGLDFAKDEIIEAAMLKFRYSDQDEITGVSDTFQCFNQPSIAIPPDVVELTGISNGMVEGHRIDAAVVEAFVAEAHIILAHNAAFDRRFAEQSWGIFRHKHWACSFAGIDWRKHGFAGAKLAYLLNEFGFFHGAHRALDDCHAVLEILARPLPETGRSTLAVLLENARCKTFRIWAEGAPFELKEILKRRKYRWNDGSDGRPKSWHIDIEEAGLADEMAFLRNEIYGYEADLSCSEITSLDRYSTRA